MAEDATEEKGDLLCKCSELESEKKKLLDKIELLGYDSQREMASGFDMHVLADKLSTWDS